MARIELRQLFDLLGASPAHSHSETIEAAYARVAQLAQSVPPADRAQMLADPGLRLRSARLVALLATSEPDVANAAITKAALSDDEWQDLIPAVPPAARAAMRRRGDLSAAAVRRLDAAGAYERGLPAARDAVLENAPPEISPLPVAVPATAEPLPSSEGISAIVRRIEAYRAARLATPLASAPATADAPRLPLGEEARARSAAAVQSCDFATDLTGRIAAADPNVAPMLIGLALNRSAGLDLPIRQHQPIIAQQVTLSGAPAISGTWQIDAAPRFAQPSGGFTGYDGRMRRTADASAAAPLRTDSEADRIRQMLHELRTPVNAVQGFAEVIQQQLFGPTPHEYRALAAAIAGDAARILAAFEELERMARLESGALQLDPGSTDLAAVLHATAAQLDTHLAQRSVAFAITGIAAGQSRVPMDAADSERLAWRLLATLGGAAAPGETLGLAITQSALPATTLDIALDLPAALRAKAQQDVFQAGVGAVPQAVTAGVFGIGFALRLARAEARAGGGDLTLVDGKLVLRLPDLTRPTPHHSDTSAANGN